jgi:Ni,Fe-hydrogenase I small subunit
MHRINIGKRNIHPITKRNNMNFDDIITELVALEYEVTLANMNGHKASDDDEYAGKRKRVGELREMLNELENGN